MKILVESHIPFVKGVFEQNGHDVIYLAPEDIDNNAVKDADALMVRTRTRCDESLLNGSKVKIIATATIGVDHIDLNYCRKVGIKVSNAPGCNAPAVAQYVLSAISRLRPGERPTIGIVGVGHVGSIVQRWAKANGFPTLLNDPPKGMPDTIEEVADKADVITFHTPLDYTTRHMANVRFFESLRRKPVIINAARGPVIDTPALLHAIDKGFVSDVVIDCWEGEPVNINRYLLDAATIATPHIAGYSSQGKQRATAMAVHAIDPSIILPTPSVAQAPTLQSIIDSYNPLTDTGPLKSAPADFENLRNNYNYRNEPI